MVNTQTAFPKLNSEFVDSNRQISIPWYRFLVSLWNRTGGSSGTLSAMLDNISSEPGALLYRGAAEWDGLPPGPVGKVLATNSHASPPDWEDRVQSVATGTGLVGGPITSSGTISFAPVNDQTLLGNASGALAPPAPLAQPTVKTMLNFVGNGDAAGGVLAGTYPSPSLANNVVGNSALAKMPAVTVKGNASGAVANAADLTVSQLWAMLGMPQGPGRPNFLATLSATQAATGGTDKILFNNVLENNGGYYDGVTNYRFTPLVAGLYSVTLCVFGYGTTVTAVDNYLYKNGVIYSQAVTRPKDYTSTVTNILIRLNGTTDYIEAFGRVIATSGQSFLGAGSTADSWFQAFRVGS